LSRTEKAVKEIAHRINKQIYTSEGKIFLVACINILKVNSVKAKYMIMTRSQNAGQNKKCNKFFEKVEDLRYLGTSLTNQNSFMKK